MSAPAVIGGAIRVLACPQPTPEASPLPLPWCTRREAGEYLRFSGDWIDQRLVEITQHPRRVPGKIRFTRVTLEDSRRESRPGVRAAYPLRLVSEDVIAILPPPPEDVR